LVTLEMLCKEILTSSFFMHEFDPMVSPENAKDPFRWVLSILEKLKVLFSFRREAISFLTKIFEREVSNLSHSYTGCTLGDEDDCG
jgi:hypothetical protein